MERIGSRGRPAEGSGYPRRRPKFVGVFRTRPPNRRMPRRTRTTPSIYVQSFPQIQIVLLMPLATPQVYDLTEKSTA
jgi:hypothetical protein